jgi:microcystin-dependent protein
MPQKFSNNSRSKLASGITSADVSFSVLSGAGDLFPVANTGAGALPSTNDWFKVAITDVSGDIEFLGVRTRASGSDVMSSVVRGIDGTTARAWGVGSAVLQTLSAADVQAAFNPPPPSVAPADVGGLANTQLGMVGMVAHFARASAPTGWLKANGAAVSRTTYAALFAVIGTTFGVGDGSTTFNLPDMRGVHARGLDDGRGLDAGRTLGSYQADDIKSHTHNYVLVGGTQAAASGTVRYPIVGTANSWQPTTATGIAENRVKNVALLACIKF